MTTPSTNEPHAHSGIFKASLLSAAIVLSEPNAVSAVLPFLSEEYPNQSAATLETFITMGALGGAVGSFVSGAIADRVGKKTLVVVSLIGFVLGGMLPMIVIGNLAYGWVLASRLLMGFSLGVLNPLVSALIGSYYRGRERDTMMGWMGTAQNIGGTLMPIIAGGLIAIEWRLAFLVYLTGLVSVFMFWKWIPEPERGRAADVERTAISTWRLPAGVWFAAIIMAAVQSCTGVFMFGTSLAVVTEKQITSASVASLMNSCITLAAIVVSLAFGWLFSKLRAATGPIFLGLWTVAALMAHYTDSVVVFFIACLLSGASQCFIIFVLTVVNREVDDDQRASANAVVTTLMQAAGFVSPFVLGGITSIMGSDTATAQFLGAAVVIGIVTIITAVFYAVHGVHDTAESAAADAADAARN